MRDLEKRVAALEKETAVMNAKIDGIRNEMATKADLHAMKASLIQWMVATMLAAAGLAAAITFGAARLFAS